MTLNSIWGTISPYLTAEFIIFALGFATVIFESAKLIHKGVMKIVKAIDVSPYAFLFVRWFLLEKRKTHFPQELKKRFILEEDLDMITRMQFFIDGLDKSHLDVVNTKYSELEHPLFVWHDKLFCKSNTNQVISLDTGNIGIIPEDENVSSIKSFDSLIHLSSILEINRRVQKKFEEMNLPL